MISSAEIVDIESKKVFNTCIRFSSVTFQPLILGSGLYQFDKNLLQDALELMSVIAVMVNCALVGISGLSDRLFPDLTLAERIIFIVILEVTILSRLYVHQFFALLNQSSQWEKGHVAEFHTGMILQA